jgi:hypothetical protein
MRKPNPWGDHAAEDIDVEADFDNADLVNSTSTANRARSGLVLTLFARLPAFSL